MTGHAIIPTVRRTGDAGLAELRPCDPQPVALDAADHSVEFVQLPLSEADSAAFQDLLGWWESMRGSRAMPSRVDIDPAALRALLPRLLLIEVQREPPDLRYRLAGTQTRDIHGFELTGRSVLDMVPRGQGRHLWNDCCHMLRHREPQHVLLRFTNRGGRQRRYRVLRVPLSNDGRAVDHILIVQDYGLDARALGDMYRDYRRGSGLEA